MRHILRRALFVPIFLILWPVMYTVSWLIDGHKPALHFANTMLAIAWGEK